jgi:hypothetical protein
MASLGPWQRSCGQKVGKNADDNLDPGSYADCEIILYYPVLRRPEMFCSQLHLSQKKYGVIF